MVELSRNLASVVSTDLSEGPTRVTELPPVDTSKLRQSKQNLKKTSEHAIGEKQPQ